MHAGTCVHWYMLVCVEWSESQCGAVRCPAVQWYVLVCAVEWSESQCGAVRCSAVLCSAMRCAQVGAVQCDVRKLVWVLPTRVITRVPACVRTCVPARVMVSFESILFLLSHPSVHPPNPTHILRKRTQQPCERTACLTEATPRFMHVHATLGTSHDMSKYQAKINSTI